jgi:hypothetical protein
MVVPLASIAFLAVRLLSSSAGVAALAVRL